MLSKLLWLTSFMLCEPTFQPFFF